MGILKIIGDVTLTLLTLMFSMLEPNFLWAQQNDAIRFQHLEIGDGLPQSTVNCIAQDSVGFIWFGTMGGLCRYDGYEFKTFQQKIGSENSLPNNAVMCVAVLPRNQMLIGTTNGLAIFDVK